MLIAPSTTPKRTPNGTNAPLTPNRALIHGAPLFSPGCFELCPSVPFGPYSPGADMSRFLTLLTVVQVNII